MGKYTSDGETSRLKFPDGQWVDLKTEQTQEDRDFIVSNMVKISAQTDGKDSRLEMHVAKLDLMERAIVAWSFEGLALTRENISSLKRKYRELILVEIDRLDKESQTFSKN